MNVYEMSKILNKSPQLIRYGLQQNRFPFGTAIQKPNNKWTYILIEKKFADYVGITLDELNNRLTTIRKRWKSNENKK